MCKYFSKAKCIIIFLILTFATVSILFYLEQFRVSKIILGLSSKNDHPIPATTRDIKTLFDQPLAYLGEGNQAYAFKTENEEFVIKFFKLAPLSSNSWLNAFAGIPIIDSYLIRDRTRSQRKFNRLFKAYEIAFCHDQDNCGLKYIHLYQTNDLNLYADVTDTFGIHHRIFIDDYAFVVQKMGIPLQKLLKQEIKERKIDSVKKKLHQVISMYIEEYQRGIVDNDHNLMTNVGFADGRPIRIDVGKIALEPSYIEKEVYIQDLNKIIRHRIAKWLKRYSPEHADEILQSLEVYLQ